MALPSVVDMSYVNHVTLEVTDIEAATRFCSGALGLDPGTSRVRLRQVDAPAAGFRGFALTLITAQPADVDALVDAASGAGATILKPPTKSIWGYGASLQAPDGTVWQVASESKKNSGPPTTDVVEIVLLLGVADVKATKRAYVERGLEVKKSFGGKYVEFASPDGAVNLALYGHDALAKQVGVPAEGSGSHRIVLSSTAGPFTDPDGFVWEAPATA